MTTKALTYKAGFTRETQQVEIEVPIIRELMITFPFFRKNTQEKDPHNGWIECVSIWNDGYCDRYVESIVHKWDGEYRRPEQKFIDEDDVIRDYTDSKYQPGDEAEFYQWLSAARAETRERFNKRAGIKETL